MRETSFYQRILHLGNCLKITSLERNEETKIIRFRMEFVRGSKVQCKRCGHLSASVYNHREWEWGHLKIFEYRCYAVAGIPWIMCSRCGVLEQVKTSWAAPYMRYTQSFMDYILLLLTKV